MMSKTLCLLILFVCLQSCSQKQKEAPAHNVLVGGGCQGCELIYEQMPAKMNWSDTTMGWAEEEKKLILSGVVYKANGKTPASGIALYCWHTDDQGLYDAGELDADEATQHGRLRAWMKTDELGRYELVTNMPAPYPNRVIPAHIHIVVLEPGINEYYIDNVEFDSDTLLTPAIRASRENRGGSGFVEIFEKDAVAYTKRNIILGKNIPNYPY
ncbi:MAG: intradiol ring-cleavage dioxygenase [Bacteroidia bacterium]